MDSDEQKCVARALEGDHEAYGRLVDSYQGMVFAVALNVTGNYADSEDVLQEVFLRAYAKLRTLSDPARFGGWLYRLARNTAIQFLRRNRHVAIPVADDGIAELVVSDAESPAESYARRELSSLLWTQVAELPPNAREAIMLYYAQGFSVRRAAEFLGISEAAFRMRLQFGREKLREAMLDRMELELRKHQPGADTRNRILAALPLGGLPLVPGAEATAIGRAGSTVLALAAKKLGTVIGIAIVACAAVVGTYQFSRGPDAPSPTPVGGSRLGQDVSTSGTSDTEAQGRSVTGTMSLVQARHRLGGRILDKVTSQSIAGVRVTLADSSGKAGEWVSGIDGRYAFAEIQAGHYTLSYEAVDPLVAAKYYPPSAGNRIMVNLSGSDIADLDLVMLPATFIAGKVLDTDDRPVTSALLRMDNRETTSTTEGQFRFAGLPPGYRYVIHCSAPGFGPVITEELRTEVGKPLENLIIRLARGQGASASGRVVNRQGQPIESYLVTCGQTWIDHDLAVLTDKDGRFRLTGIRPGPARVRTRPTHAKDADLRLSANQEVKDLELVVDQPILPGFVSGVIVDENGQPVTTGYVRAGIPEEQKTCGMTIPDAQGQFRIGNLKPGTKVEIGCEGVPAEHSYRKTSAVGVAVSSADLRVQLGPEQSIGETGVVRGRVIDRKTRQPISRFTATTMHSSSFRPTAQDPFTRTQEFFSAEGKYALAALLVRTHDMYLYVEAPGYIGKHVPLRALSVQQPDVELTPGGFIEGHVVNDKEQPVAGARVSLRNAQDSCVLTDAAGHFHLSGLYVTARECLWVSHPDYAPFFEDHLSISEKTAVRDMKIRMSKGGIVMGAVVDEGGRPVKEAVVIVARRLETTYYLRTDTNGIYSAELVPPDTYAVYVANMEYEKRSVALKDGETAYVDFGVVGAKITGKITVNGKPLPEAELILGRRPGALAYSGYDRIAECTSGRDGHYALRNISEGKYFLRVFVDRTKCLCSIPVSVEKGQDVGKDLTLQAGGIRGSVVAGQGDEPAAGARVELYDGQPANVSQGSGRLFGSSEGALGFSDTDRDGRFSFEHLAAGTYLLHTIGAGKSVGVYTPVTLAEGSGMADVVVRLNNLGKLRVKAVDARTGAELALKGSVLLKDADGRMETARLREPTPCVLEGIPAGTWFAASMLEDEQDVFYTSELLGGINTSADTVTDLVLRVEVAVEVCATVDDKRGVPPESFDFAVYDRAGIPIPPRRVSGNRVHFLASPGSVHLVITQSGKVVHDGTASVPPDARDELRIPVTLSPLSAP